MPSLFFQFKQFTVFHDKCAMKVGTDGVLLGAWADCENVRNILDVGTGSGLIALMLAQRSKAIILGLDIEKEACSQAQFNVSQSPFADRIVIAEFDYGNFNSNQVFDLIVSNPPFFINSLKSPGKERSRARHSDEFFIETFLTKSVSLLAPNGKISMILPFDAIKNTADIIAAGLGLNKVREARVKPLPQKSPKRVLLEYSVQTQPLETSELCIELSRHVYSEEYITLTKDFYLKM